ncbi:Maf family protein [Deltaproteobacteria bacterium OttesenSCG-928-K17]|nr:Maf family protein [Deltaproteobacteria bacterium OttesenSCG-928-K17]
MTIKLILASASPRRADLLRWAGVDIEIDPADIDEKRAPGESPPDLVLRLARQKALAKAGPGRITLGADTTVFLGDRIFEKPADPAEAAEHLAALSGRTHTVATAFALTSDEYLVHSQTVTSQVAFRHLSNDMIARYVATGEGLDKAGAYGLQGLGGFLVENISGSYTSVIGLPLTEVLKAIKTL